MILTIAVLLKIKKSFSTLTWICIYLYLKKKFNGRD